MRGASASKGKARQERSRVLFYLERDQMRAAIGRSNSELSVAVAAPRPKRAVGLKRKRMGGAAANFTADDEVGDCCSCRRQSGLQSIRLERQGSVDQEGASRRRAFIGRSGRG